MVKWSTNRSCFYFLFFSVLILYQVVCFRTSFSVTTHLNVNENILGPSSGLRSSWSRKSIPQVWLKSLRIMEWKKNNKNMLFFQDMFQGTGKLLVKAYVQMPMDVRGPPGQFQNLFNWFLVPCLHLSPSFKSTFRRIVLGGNPEGIEALCDQDPSCKAFAFSAEENAVEMRYAIRDQKSFC